MKKSPLKISWGMLFRACEDPNLSDGACRLHTRVLSLSKKEGYCWANNSFLARELNVSKASVSRRVSELSELGYIRIEIDKDSGNKRYIYPLDFIGTSSNAAPSSTQDCDDPIDNGDDTSVQMGDEPLSTDAETSPQKIPEALSTNAEHNKRDVTKEKEQNKGEQFSVIVDTTTKNGKLSERGNSESTPFAPYSEAAMEELLGSGRMLSDMDVAEQVQVVIAFCLALGEPMNNFITYAERISAHIRRNCDAERLMHAIWRMYNTSFGRQFESKLNYFFGKRTQSRIDNALDDGGSLDEYDISEHHRNAVLPFNQLLEKDFQGIQN